MSTWRGRLAAGAMLAAAAGLLLTLGYGLYTRRLLMNPSDAALAARWRAHRAEFEELKEIERARRTVADSGPAREDSPPGAARNAAGELRRRALTRRLGLDGTGWIAPDSFVYFGAAAWYPRVRWQDVKGYAYATRPPADLVADLDQVIAHPRERGDVLRWHRALEADWYLFREIGGSDHR